MSRQLPALPGACLLVAPRQAYRLTLALDALDRALRNRDGTGLPADVADMRTDLADLGATWLEQQASRGTDPDVSASVPQPVAETRWGHDLIDADQAADLLGCTPHNVRDLGRRGRLPVHRRGRSVRFDRADVIDYRDHLNGAAS